MTTLCNSTHCLYVDFHLLQKQTYKKTIAYTAYWPHLKSKMMHGNAFNQDLSLIYISRSVQWYMTELAID